MLPTDTGRKAVKYDLDNLFGELNTPKEQILPPPPPAGQQTGPDGNYQFSNTPGGDLETEQITPEQAALTGKIIAGTIDEALGTGLSLYARNSEKEKYQASESQIQKIGDSWAKVAQHSNFKIEDAPWFNAIFLTGAVYLPKVMEAKNDRRFALIDEKIREEQAAREALSKRMDDLENKK
jgi:hypothetical protein